MSSEPGLTSSSDNRSEQLSWGIRRKIGLIGAVAALVCLYFASGSPIPLYSVYQAELGLTHAQLSMTSMWYLLGTVFPLLFLSRLSNHLGRKPVTILTICLSISGCCVYIGLTSPELLMAARFIQGLASGLGSSTVASYVVDLCTGLPKWVGPAITSSAPALGLSTGAFISGGAYEFTSVSDSSIFSVISVVLVVITVMVFIGTETMGRHPGALRSIRPTITVGKGLRRMFLASTMIFIGTWAVGGFYQAFSSTFVIETTGSMNSFVAAALFTASLLPNAIGSFFANRFDLRAAQRWGMIGYTVFTLLALMSLMALSLPAFASCIMVAAFMQGIAFTASVTGLISRTDFENRAGMFSTIYLTSYGGAAIPNLVVGMIAGESSSVEIMSWYCILAVFMMAILLVLTAKKYDEVPARDVV